MRPIKEIQQATHFKRLDKHDLLKKGLITKDEIQGDLSDFAWKPVCTDSRSEDFDSSILQDSNVQEIDLVEISENNIYVRKANIKDFKKSILNCKPTVNQCFLELYAKFLQKYGHEDQKEFSEPMV